MWHLKTTTVPVVISALGMVAKTAPNYVSQIPGAPFLTELPKMTLMKKRTYPTKTTINVIIYTINFKLDFSNITYLRFLGRTWFLFAECAQREIKQ